MIIACVVIAILVAQTPTPAPNKNTQATFSISISTGEDIMTAAPDIALNVLFTNTSSSDIRLFKTNGKTQGEFLNDVEVRDRKGSLAPKTKYLRILKGEEPNDGPVYSRQSALLHPGESMQEQLILNKLYDLSRPDTYTIQVSRMDSQSGVMVKSNVLTVLITQ